MFNTVQWLIKFGVKALAFLCLLLIPERHPERPLVEQIEQQGELVVATRWGPATYFSELRQDSGFEFELARSFANHLGVQLRIATFSSFSELLAAVRQGQVHFAAAGLTITDRRQQLFDFSIPYQEIKHQLVYKIGRPKPREIQDLVGKRTVVIAGSSHSEHLLRMRDLFPELQWEEEQSASELILLNMVNDGLADYAVVDSKMFLNYRDVYPELRSAMNITGSLPVAWAFNKHQDRSLLAAADRFLFEAANSGQLEELSQRFFGHQRFDYVGSRTFLEHIDSRLHHYENAFRAQAKLLGVDWRLLAAIGYQESFWDAKAVSPTGVRGLMMLTRGTAAEMGVSNRLDPLESIAGGAHYFKKLHDRLPAEIQEPDRTFFALAAYNLGYKHLMTARKKALQAGADPNDWFVTRDFVALLSHQKKRPNSYYRYKRAGEETVDYVRNIRRYYEALVWASERERKRYMPVPQSLVAMRSQLVH